MGKYCEQGHSVPTNALFCATCGATIQKSKARLTKRTKKITLSLPLFALISVMAAMLFGGNSTYTLRVGQTFQDSIAQPSCLPNGDCIAPGFSSTYLSSNSGKSWSYHVAVPGGLMQQIECQSDSVCVAVGNTFPGGGSLTSYPTIWTSFDKGLNWQRTYFAYPNSYGAIFVVSCPTSMFCLAIGENKELVSSSGGASWRELPGASISKISARYLKCFDTSNCLMASVNYSGNNNNFTIYRTTDFGLSWSKAGFLKNAMTPFNCFSSKQCVTSTVKYDAKGATIGSYLTSTLDGGVTWSYSREIAQLKNRKQGLIEDSSCSTMTNCVVLANEHSHPYAGQSTVIDPEYILQTTDGGNSWSKIRVPSYWQNLQWVTCLPTSRCIVGASPPIAANLTQTRIFTLK